MKKLNGIYKKIISISLAVVMVFSMGVTPAGRQEVVEAAASTTPKMLDITTTGGNSTIKWESVNDADGYNIYHADTRYGEYTKINNKIVTTTEFTSHQKGYYKVAAVISGKEKNMSEAISEDIKLFGPNVYIFDEKDNQDEVQNIVYDIYDRQEAAQFGSGRYALLFKPGTYSTQVNVGFYTQVAGLGMLPTDTTFQPTTDSQGNKIGGLECGAYWWPMTNGHVGYNATLNFWRSAENFQVNNDVMWAVSQAVSLRRMQINGKLTLHHLGGWSSGGFLADSVIKGNTESGSQQQWLSRNTDWNSWTGENWNMVFVGIAQGKAPTKEWPEHAYTVVENSPVVREKPFLTVDDQDNYSVFVPELRKEAKDVSWKDGAKGETIAIDKFYVAKPDVDTADTINKALATGKHLILTPGIYKINQPIKVTNPNTVVLGLGLATLESTNGNSCMEISDVDGVKVAGILFDAGEKSSEVLLRVGETGSNKNHSANPTSISDVYIRIGGEHTGRAETSMIINSNNVIGDNFWIWRADHGAGAAWDTNVTKNGLVVNGDNVTIYALMVEHYHEYQTVWNGNGGQVFFYQSEIPYDVPNQEAWMSNNGTVNGYASYKVSDNVTSHNLYGAGIYSYHRDARVDLNSAIEIPDTKNVKITNACTVMLAGYPGISHVVNNAGGSVSVAGGRQTISEYADNVAAPTITPKTGFYYNDKDISITTATPGAKIIYTIDGTEPSENNGIVYTKPFQLAYGKHTVKVVAIKSGKTNSYVTTETITIGNALYGKKATASSKSSDAGKAIDGSMTTRWQADAEDPQWLMVDLEKEYVLSSFYIVWETAAGKDYTIEVSQDGKTWSSVYQVTGGEKAHSIYDSFDETKARYIRVNIATRATQYGASIYEFQVYGKTTTEIELPDAPVSISADILSETKAEIRWDKTDEADSYNVYRAVGTTGGYRKINTSPITGTNFTDTNLSNNIYLYKVTSVNAAGESVKSDFVTVNLAKDDDIERPTETGKSDDDVYIRSISRASITGVDENGYLYTGKAIQPEFSVLYAGKQLVKGQDYTIAYKNNLYPGTAIFIITGKGKYGGEKTVEFNIKESDVSVIWPAETTTVSDRNKVTKKDDSKGNTTVTNVIPPKKVKKLKLKKVLPKAALIRWKLSKKAEKVKGYQIVYSTSKKFKKNVKKKTVSYKKFKKSKKTYKLKKLKSGKIYYVKVRAYKKVNGVKIYGKFKKMKKFKAI